MKKALIIFVKTPVAGKVKTRLQPHLSTVKILKLYKSFVSEIMDRCATLRGVDKFLGCAPAKEDDFLLGLSKTYKLEGFNQKGKDLGEKLINAFKEHFRRGYTKVVIIGSDSPTIPVDFIKQAFKKLDKKDFVVGPCCDGGYYLVGAKKMFNKVFRGIPWDSSEVLNKTLDKLDSLDVKFSLLPFWYDVDTIDDLRFFKKHLRYLSKNIRQD